MGEPNALIQEDCPSCGVKITLRRKALTKKVRCPNCRLVVIVPSSAPEASQPSGSAFAIAAISPAENSQEFRVDPIERGAGFLSEKQKNSLVKYLGGEGERHITIRAHANDPDALLFSHTLLKIFRGAGWDVSISTPTVPLAPGHGRKTQGALALYTGSWPFPDEVTKTCMALTAANLEFSSHIDPDQVREKAILVIGRDIRQSISEGRGRGWQMGASHANLKTVPEDHETHPVFEELSDADWTKR